MLADGLHTALDLDGGGGRIGPAKGDEEECGGGPESNGGEEDPAKEREAAAAHVSRIRVWCAFSGETRGFAAQVSTRVSMRQV